MFFKRLDEDVRAVLDNDPAARSRLEILITYPGVHALSMHRLASSLFRLKLRLPARIVANICRSRTGIDIHPGARIASGVFIDHGSGVVIGETASVGKGTVLYQGCTLGGTGKEKGKRHPTVGEYCVISAGAKVLGNITVGNYSRIGAGAVVLTDIPPHCTAVGVPAKIVVKDGKKVKSAYENL